MNEKFKNLIERAEKLAESRGDNGHNPIKEELNSVLAELASYQEELDRRNEEAINAQSELERSRRKHAFLYELAPVGFLTLNRDSRILNVNSTTTTILGEPKEELLDRLLADFVSPDSLDSFEYHLTRSYETNFKSTTVIKARSGFSKTVYLEITSVPFVDEETQEKLLHTAIQDVTYKIESEREILRLSQTLEESIAARTREMIRQISEFEESARELRLTSGQITRIIDSLNGYIWSFTIGRSGEVLTVFFSDSVEAVTGYPPSFFYNDFYSGITLISAPDDEDAEEKIKEMLSKEPYKKFRDWETRIKTRDGRVRWAHQLAMYWLDEEGTLRVDGITLDIHEQKLAKEALAYSKSIMEAIFRAASQIIIVIVEKRDDRYLIAEFSPGAERFTDLSKIDALRRDVSILFEQDCARKVYMALDSIEGSHGELSLECDIKKADGSAFPAYLMILPIENGAGELPSALIFAIDLSNLKETEKKLLTERMLLGERIMRSDSELAALNAELRRASRVRSDILATVSHELRTPLSAVIGLSESLIKQLKNSLNEKQSDALMTIFDNGQKLLEMITSMLDYSKIDSGYIEYNPRKISADMIARSALQTAAAAAAKKKITTHFNSNGLTLAVNVDRDKFRQILITLLDNAIKFTPSGGEIGIEVWYNSDAQEINFVVWDSGVGIDLDKIYDLFQPFSQSESGLARNFEGSGIGLALALKLVDLHYGGIKVERIYPTGTKISVIIPLKEESLHRRPLTCPVKTESGAVLIIDDNFQTPNDLIASLSMLDLKCMTVHTEEEALRALADYAPELVFVSALDPRSPRISELAETLRLNATRSTKIIAYSSLYVPEKSSLYVSNNLNGFLIKPFSPEKVFNELLKLR